ncbi:MAG: DUF2380 domain-containing protein [Candidatus Competibacterales bacterium]
MVSSHRALGAVGSLVALLLATAAGASPAPTAPHIAVMAFELNDLTLDPRTPEELERTASIKPLLEETLNREQIAQLVSVTAEAEAANVAVGYLFERPQELAAVGQTLEADYAVVGKVHKPSFLFVYLLVRMVEVKSGRWVGDYTLEIKGPQERLTRRAVERLAERIDRTVANVEGRGSTPLEGS